MLVEYDERIEDKVFAWIKRYILRAKVKITPLDDKIIYSAEKFDNSYEDGRTPLMGFRSIGHANTISSESFNQNDYTKLRYRLGIPEGFEEFGISKAVPQEFNLDYLHGIDYRKGCYVGQELVITVHHKGQVRKRILPVNVNKGTQLNLGDELVLDTAKDSKRAPGKVICSNGNLGLAMMRLSELESSKSHFVRTSDGCPVSVSIPQWFPNK
jgi:folate-binding protein YgfZ